MSVPASEISGVVVSDAEWHEYWNALVSVAEIKVRFKGEKGKARIWRVGDELHCRLRDMPHDVQLIPYSRIPQENTDPATASAEFMTQLIAGGVADHHAIRITQQLYSRREHMRPISAALRERIIEQWRGVP